MDAPQALADLTEISSQVVDVAIIDTDGSVMATTAEDPARAERFATGVARLVEQADALREARNLPDLAQLEAATLEGSVFVVRRNGRLIAATTRPDPTVGLVFYDLKHCLRTIEDEAAAPAQATPAEPAPVEPAADPATPDAEPATPADEPAAKPRATRKKTDAPA